MPVPVVVRTREYGTPEFYASLTRHPRDGAARKDEARRAKEIDELFRE
ncbi:MAG: hypothetical protein Q8P22_04155 [Chloroflexota bacterium]|nr:hypothetical protein [Chloroflexota bacterium]